MTISFNSFFTPNPSPSMLLSLSSSLEWIDSSSSSTDDPPHRRRPPGDDDDVVVCTPDRNPYAAHLTEGERVIGSRVEAWLRPPALEAMLHRAGHDGAWKRNWNAYREVFDPMAECAPDQRVCIGGPCRSDESKVTCGINALRPGCVVYSIGGNDQWGFETDVLEKTPCTVHTFDCTGPRSRFHPPVHERLHFHHVCLGAYHEDAPTTCQGKKKKCGPTWTLLEIQQKLDHKHVDLHKMDIEGFEWPIFDSWPELGLGQSESGISHGIIHNNNNNSSNSSSKVVLPTQLLVEIHYKTRFSALWKPNRTGFGSPFKDPPDIVLLQAHLLRMGYIVVERDDNRFCNHCTELTLIRIKSCPSSSSSESNLLP